MSLTRLEGKTYIARALSGSSDPERLAQAQDSLFAAIEEWNIRNDWSFLTMDTSGGFSVAACTSNGATPSVITTTTANGFAGVNVSQTATGLSGTATVASVDSTTQFTATGTVTGGPVTLVFSADIPVRATFNTYNLPSPIKRPYSARLIVNNKRLEYRDQRRIDRMFSNLTVGGEPGIYNVFNSVSFTTGSQNGKVRLFPIPSSSETLRVRYHRPIAQPATDGTSLDLPDRYVYALLELGKYNFLKDLDSENPRTGECKERAEHLLRKAVWDDREGSGDNDLLMIPHVDHGQFRQIDSSDAILEGWW